MGRVERERGILDGVGEGVQTQGAVRSSSVGQGEPAKKEKG